MLHILCAYMQDAGPSMADEILDLFEGVISVPDETSKCIRALQWQNVDVISMRDKQRLLNLINSCLSDRLVFSMQLKDLDLFTDTVNNS